MCKRKSGKDLRKEFTTSLQKHNALYVRIVKRAEDLVEQFPNVPYGITTLTTSEFNETNTINVNSALNLIECIEKYNVEQSGIVQTEIKFKQ
jgi:hypothetical protein